MNPKSSKFKSNDRVRIAKHKNIFSKGYTEHWSKEIFLIDSVLKTNPWRYRVGQKKRTQISNLYISQTVISINAILSITYL